MIEDIHLKDVIMEDFCNYQKPSMFLISSICNWKCCIEQHLDISICQNSPLTQLPTKSFKISSLYNAYISNDISKAIIFGGLEPLLQIDEVEALISYFRAKGCQDDIVIFTGYTEEELQENGSLDRITPYKNIILKFGRYIPNQFSHYDPILGITLVSENQYSKRYN